MCEQWAPQIFIENLVLETSVSGLPDKLKYRLVVKYHERHRAASDGESDLSPEALARDECGLSKAMVSYIRNGRPLKDAKKRAQFEAVFRKRAADVPLPQRVRIAEGE